MTQSMSLWPPGERCIPIATAKRQLKLLLLGARDRRAQWRNGSACLPACSPVGAALYTPVHAHVHAIRSLSLSLSLSLAPGHGHELPWSTEFRPTATEPRRSEPTLIRRMCAQRAVALAAWLPASPTSNRSVLRRPPRPQRMHARGRG
jgi:hypothetical protein